ncbi:MAG: hypothetical protein PVG59_15905, partial [Desulfobacterales bacterium]
MKIVPTYRLLLLVGFVLLPGTFLFAIAESLTIAVILLAAGLVAASTTDACRSRGRLHGIQVMLPEVVRISRGRPGSFDVQIENESQKLRRLRLGLAFPEQIDAPTIELAVELPPDTQTAMVAWSLTGLKQGRFLIDRCYLETASPWGLWSVRSAAAAHMEIRVYPSLFDEHKNLSGLFLNRGLGIHAQRQVG